MLLKKDTDAKLYAVSVDPPQATKDFAAKLAADGQGEIRFPLLSDSEHRIIDAYGLHDPAYDDGKLNGIPHPAVFVIDKKGTVAWSRIESNYRERPTIDEIRTALYKLK